MSGGTVTLGLTPKEATALATATGKAQVKQLEAIVRRLNAEQVISGGNDKLSLGVVEAFLTTLKGKKVPQSEWSVVFGELTRHYLQLGIRIQGTPVTSNDINDLVSKADSARKSGDFDQADSRLAEASDIAMEDARRTKLLAREPARQAASLLASRATLALTRLEHEKSAKLFEQAFEIRTGDVSPETMWWLFQAGDAWASDGQTAKEMRVYKLAQSVARHEIETKGSELERELSVSLAKIGRLQMDLGNSSGALNNLQGSLGISERLVAKDPRNLELSHDLSVIYGLIGRMERDRGNSESALKNFLESQAITERLASIYPHNPELQFDLSIGNERIGDEQMGRGDSTAALKTYQVGLAIREQLASRYPSNLEFQRALGISYSRVGDVQVLHGNHLEAFNYFNKSLSISKELAASDLRNSEFQRDLSVCLLKFGHLQKSIGDTTAALRSFQAALTIRERLAFIDPNHAQHQYDLASCYQNIGDAQMANGNIPTALKSFQSCLTILEPLTVSDPANAVFQRSLGVTNDRMGQAQKAQGDITAALKNFQSSHATAKRLVTLDPSRALFQRDLAISLLRLASLGPPAGTAESRRALLREGLTILDSQRRSGKLPASSAQWIKEFEDAIEALN